jgi:hypothetical protein
MLHNFGHQADCHLMPSIALAAKAIASSKWTKLEPHPQAIQHTLWEFNVFIENGH